nr:aminopeptidase P family protein [Propionicicella superfundia]
MTSDERPALPNRQTPFSAAFRAFIPDGWQDYPTTGFELLAAAERTPARRGLLSARFPGERLVLPAGGLRTRSNDCDYRFRPHTAFAYYTGLGTDREPDAVLLLDPAGDGHAARLYFRPRAPRTDEEFYADSRYGEMWVGQRESLAEMAALTGVECRPADDLAADLAAGDVPLRVVPGADDAVSAQVAAIRADRGTDPATAATADEDLGVFVSESRLVKDAYEIAELEAACADTAVGFEAVVRELPAAVANGRGERWVEGVFGLHARHRGNAVGYDTIAAAGDHACTLHWIRNDGDIRPGELILMDAGVERDSLYTADITRTLPVTGRFSPAQRRVYDAVLEAADAAMAVVRPGTRYGDVHEAAIAVIARHLEEWGILPVPAAQSLDTETGGHHRRWMVHGTSHHLGLDVHDCAQARRENYRDGLLAPGMVVTVEPGLYFKATDLLVPAEYRGIGVRIEDDVLVTEEGPVILSHHLPRTADEVEDWMGRLLDTGA